MVRRGYERETRRICSGLILPKGEGVEKGKRKAGALHSRALSHTGGGEAVPTPRVPAGSPGGRHPSPFPVTPRTMTLLTLRSWWETPGGAGARNGKAAKLEDRRAEAAAQGLRIGISGAGGGSGCCCWGAGRCRANAVRALRALEITGPEPGTSWRGGPHAELLREDSTQMRAQSMTRWALERTNNPGNVLIAAMARGQNKLVAEILRSVPPLH